MNIHTLTKFLGASLFTFSLTISTAFAATYVVSNTGDSGDGSLRQAILNANATSDPDDIVFNIGVAGDGAVVQTITPLTPLPKVQSYPVNIDGFSQYEYATGDALPTLVRPHAVDSPLHLVVIDGTTLQVAGAIELQLHNGSTVRGLKIQNFPFGSSIFGGCIILSAASVNTVADNVFDNCIVGIGMTQGSGVNTVEYNSVYDAVHGIIFAFSANDNVVAHNHIEFTIRGILFGLGAERSEIIENTIKSSLRQGIENLQNLGSNSLIQGNKLSDNNLLSTNLGAIHMIESHGDTIIDNVITSTNGYGISLLDSGIGAIIIDNVIIDARLSGIQIVSFAIPIHGIEVVGNLVSNSGSGLEIGARLQPNSDIFDISIVDNQFLNNAGDGIRVTAGAHDFVIQDNEISGNVGHGIQLAPSAPAGFALLPILNHTVLGNTIRNNRYSGIAIGPSVGFSLADTLYTITLPDRMATYDSNILSRIDVIDPNVTWELVFKDVGFFNGIFVDESELTFTTSTGTFSFLNSVPVSLPDNGGFPSPPVTRTLVVSGVTGTLENMTVTFNGLSGRLIEMEFTLKNPNTDDIVLFGKGGLGSHSFQNATVTFDDTIPPASLTLASNNYLSQNAIYDNDLLGIDLGADRSVTANDNKDVDVGANNLQNFPTMEYARVENNGEIRVHGHLKSSQEVETYRLEFFGNNSNDPSGHGEGEFYLGCSHVTTNPGGNANYDLEGEEFTIETPLNPAQVGQFVTATASKLLSGDTASCSASGNEYGDTSEFSEAVLITAQ